MTPMSSAPLQPPRSPLACCWSAARTLGLRPSTSSSRGGPAGLPGAVPGGGHPRGRGHRPRARQPGARRPGSRPRARPAGRPACTGSGTASAARSRTPSWGAADALGEPLAALLGDPADHRRFGFELSTVYQITPPRPDWQPHFQVRVWRVISAPAARHVHLPRTLRPDLRATFSSPRPKLRPPTDTNAASDLGEQKVRQVGVLATCHCPARHTAVR